MLGYRNRKRVRKLRPREVSGKPFPSDLDMELRNQRVHSIYPHSTRNAPLGSDEEDVIRQVHPVKVTVKREECTTCHKHHEDRPNCFYLR